MSIEPVAGGASPEAGTTGAGGTPAGNTAAQRSAVEVALRSRFRCAGKGDATRILFQATLEHLLERHS